MWRKKSKQSNKSLKGFLVLFVLLGLVGINIVSDTFALTYQENVPVEFTFEPSISINLSYPDLIIEDLAPGSASDSNTITVTTSTNNTTGYTLSADAGDGTTYTNTKLINGEAYFTSLATNANISGLNNLNSGYWGFAYSEDGSTWSNYSGLPYYNTTPKELASTNTNGSSSIQFKIAASADSWQASGEYKNVVNFYAVTNPEVPPVTYMQNISSATLAELMPNVGDEATLVDNRDGKSYTVAHEADGKYWMTQNLDLELTTGGAYNPTTGTSTALTSENTNLTTSGSGIYSDGYASSGGVITWTPSSNAPTASHTISGTTVSPAFSTSSYTIPESAEGGDTYIYTSGTTDNDTVFTSLSDCETTGGHTEAECKHYHVGNYYSWTAAIASNNSTNISTQYDNAANSICPAGWRLPHGRASSDTSSTREFGYLFQQAQVTSSLTATSYATDGFNKIRVSPLFFVRGGYVNGSSLNKRASYGYYWSSTVLSSNYACSASFGSSSIISATNTSRYYGRSVRCVSP